jgi:hypothetical protein
MKKVLFSFIFIVAVFFIYYGERRSFYCLTNGTCVTVWKTFNNKCYVIYGRYLGLIKPNDNYIETTNTQYLTLYFSLKLPKKIIARDEGILGGSKRVFKIFNSDIKTITIEQYHSENLNHTFFQRDSTVGYSLGLTTESMGINIKEGYAVDKNNEKL